MTTFEDRVISFDSPESSVISGARYDADTLTLVVELRAGKQTREYEFAKFPEDSWREFYQAKSKGKHFMALVRPFYTGKERK